VRAAGGLLNTKNDSAKLSYLDQITLGRVDV
jgi:hypothetical protein